MQYESYRTKDRNLKYLHKDLRHSNVKRYGLAPKRHVDIKGSDRLTGTFLIGSKYECNVLNFLNVFPEKYAHFRSNLIEQKDSYFHFTFLHLSNSTRKCCNHTLIIPL